MRLFVSVEPSAAARTELSSTISGLDVAPARPVAPERWHITLAFLGDIDGGGVPAVRDGLAAVAAGVGPLRLRLAGAGVFPDPRRPAVLWIGLTGDVDPLRRLAAQVTDALRAAGVCVERRRFAPHVTVARYRNARADATVATVAQLSGYSGPDFTITEMHLMRSHLGSPPRHDVVDTWRLGGQPTPGAGEGSAP